MSMRSQPEILEFFDGFDLVEPGVVPLQKWRPEALAESGADSKRMVGYAGVGMKGWPR
jgi:hypothetical protein